MPRTTKGTPNDAVIYVRCPKDMRRRVERAARGARRSIGDWARLALEASLNDSRRTRA